VQICVRQWNPPVIFQYDFGDADAKFHPFGGIDVSYARQASVGHPELRAQKRGALVKMSDAQLTASSRRSIRSSCPRSSSSGRRGIRRTNSCSCAGSGCDGQILEKIAIETITPKRFDAEAFDPKHPDYKF